MAEERLYASVYRQIRERITSGAWPSGHRLPPDAELARVFGVSRITVGRALQLLAWEGLLDRRPGRGSFVASHASAASPAAAHEPGPPADSPLLVGLVTPGLVEAQYLESIEAAVRARGGNVVVCLSQGRRETEAEILRELVNRGVRGIILCPVNGEFYSDEILRLHLSRYPMVLLDKRLRGISLPFVTTDNAQAAHDLTAHLIALGHSRIGLFTTAVAETSTLEERRDGYLQALAEERIVGDKAWLIELSEELHPDWEEVGQAVARARDLDLTAIVCNSHVLALVTYKSLTRIGVRVPEDVSLACFDSFGFTSLLWRPTHIAQSERAMGAEAVAMLFRLMEGETVEPAIFPGQLVLGESTGPVRTPSLRGGGASESGAVAPSRHPSH